MRALIRCLRNGHKDLLWPFELNLRDLRGLFPQNRPKYDIKIVRFFYEPV